MSESLEKLVLGSGFCDSGDESKCMESGAIPQFVEFMKSVVPLGSCSFMLGVGIVTAACRKLRMFKAPLLVYVNTCDLKL